MASYTEREGRYDIRCYCGTDINGKRINKYMTWIPEQGMTKRQIEKELKKIYEEESKPVLEIPIESSKPTFLTIPVMKNPPKIDGNFVVIKNTTTAKSE